VCLSQVRRLLALDVPSDTQLMDTKVTDTQVMRHIPLNESNGQVTDTQVMRHMSNGSHGHASPQVTDTQVMSNIPPPRPHTEREREKVRESLLGTSRTAHAPQRPSTSAQFDVRALERAGGSAENSPTGDKMPHHSARERLRALSANGGREGTDRQMLKDLLVIARAQQAILEVTGEQKGGERERIAVCVCERERVCVCLRERHRETAGSIIAMEYDEDDVFYLFLQKQNRSRAPCIP